jgi:16S rRNA A1518/A1519 N6-dimethyltransferase RsmA/KsgA/DIM1 with predicted DNA glycosylase/AP lyase activity
MKSQITLIIASLTLVATSVLAEMYRYIDENGQVVYSQFRPGPDVETQSVKEPPPPPSTAKERQQELLDNLQKQAEIKEDKKEAADKTEKEKTKEDQLKKNCEAAKKNLEYLQARDNRILLDKDGNKLSLSDAQRLQRIQKAKEVMQRDCK